MASGSYKGASIKIPDLLLYGALGFGLYYFWKTFQKPAADISQTGADVIGAAGNAAESYFNVFDDAFKWASQLIAGNNKNVITTKDNRLNQLTNDTISYKNPIKNIENTTIYGLKSSIISTNKGSTTVINAPNTYYKNLGIGFDSKGQGYSSFQPLKR